MRSEDKESSSISHEKAEEAKIEDTLGEELTDEQLLQMAEGSCSWGANCNRGC